MIYCREPLVFGHLIKGWCSTFILKEGLWWEDLMEDLLMDAG